MKFEVGGYFDKKKLQEVQVPQYFSVLYSVYSPVLFWSGEPAVFTSVPELPVR